MQQKTADRIAAVNFDKEKPYCVGMPLFSSFLS